MTDYESLGAEIGRLVKEKQIAYGDSFSKSGDVLRILYPDGVKPEQYGDLLTITRVLDKLFRVATKKDAFGESPWKDVMGYSLLAAARDAETTEKEPGRAPTSTPTRCVWGFCLGDAAPGFGYCDHHLHQLGMYR